MLDIPSEVPSFIVSVHYCVLCDATRGSLSLGISNITARFEDEVKSTLFLNLKLNFSFIHFNYIILEKIMYN